MPLWLLGGLGWLKNAGVGVFALAARYPWQAACLALLVASAWLWHGWDGAKADVAKCQTARKAEIAQWNAEVATAKAATAAAKQKGKEASDDAQTTHDQLVATTGEFDAWKRSHRVQPIAARPFAPASPGSGDNPAVHADTAAVSTVAITDADAGNWKANADYAQSCYLFGQNLIAKGLAVPGLASSLTH